MSIESGIYSITNSRTGKRYVGSAVNIKRRIFEPIKAASRLAKKVTVAFSGGKESVVVLDLCCRYFGAKNVSAFFMYYAPNLSFQESSLQFAENKYGIEIIRIPHFEMSNFMRYGVFCVPDARVGVVHMNDVYKWVRLQTGVWWIAAGERIADSIVRRAMMKKSGSVDDKRGRFYPVALFTKAEVLQYIEYHKLKRSPESVLLGSSFGDMHPKTMYLLQKHYPDDFKKICEMYPFAEAAAFNYGMSQK